MRSVLASSTVTSGAPGAAKAPRIDEPVGDDARERRAHVGVGRGGGELGRHARRAVATAASARASPVSAWSSWALVAALSA